VYPLSWLFLASPQEGARPVVFLSSSERVEGRGGGFWGTVKVKNSHTHTHTQKEIETEVVKDEEVNTHTETQTQGKEVQEVPMSKEAEDTVLAHKVWLASEELVKDFL
jgi:hypothetical protein